MQSSQQLSQIERSVTHLLVATKQLLETLTHWSRRSATENEVSDVYVRLGYEFNIACRAFTSIGVETSDLGNVPDELRKILEETLSQDASPASLDRYLPRIRDIIINLLHGLKKKQARLRQRQATQQAAGSSTTTMNQKTDSMMSSTPSHASGMTQILDDAQNKYNMESETEGHSLPIQGGKDQQLVPPRTSSSGRRDSAARRAGRYDMAPPSQGGAASATNNASSMTTSKQARSDYAQTSNYADSNGSSVRNGTQEHSPYPPPPPEPPQHDALIALARGGDLERRASRRYSAFHVGKMMGTGPNGIPMMPPPQSSPAPNRGREVRESLNAVRVRNAMTHSRTRSNQRLNEPSPARSIRRNVAGESPIYPSTKSRFHDPSDQDLIDSPTIYAPDEKVDYPGKAPPTQASSQLDAIREVSNPVEARFQGREGSPASFQLKRKQARPGSASNFANEISPTLDHTEQFIPEDSPQPGKELTLFLQYKSKIKKFTLPDGYNELSIARLQLAFIEKFAWNTHTNGDLPEIYLQDPVSGVRHELDDLNDVKDRSVLALNVEALDEIKKHFDEGLGGIQQSLLESIRSMTDSQRAALQQVQDGQQLHSRDLSRLLSMPSPPSTNGASAPSIYTRSSLGSGPRSQMNEVKGLKRDLAVMRQAYNSFVSDIGKSMTAVKEVASKVKVTAIKSSIPDVEGEGGGRAYVNSGKKSLATDSDHLVSRVDDLQDIVEDLRKDVVTRGVRPLPRQLETVSKDISVATAELKRMQEYLKREKPVWTKIWEKELDTVCTDRDLLTMQEELSADLEDDLEKAAQTFALVEQCTKEQMKDGNQPSGSSAGTPRSTSRGFAMDTAIDPQAAKEGVLGEVRALQPNHQTRLEAIERAEMLRQRELEERKDGEFKKELGQFVGEGKLKKSGGVDELERQRIAKDEAIRKEVWERMNGGTPIESSGAGAGAGDVGRDAAAAGTPQEAEPSVGSSKSRSGGLDDSNTVFVDAPEMSPEEAALLSEQITPRPLL